MFAASPLAQALTALQRARAKPASAQDRRRHRRVTVVLDGRMLGVDGREADLRTVDVSCGGARIDTSATLQPGGETVLYVDRLGRLPARVVRDESHGRWALTFDVTLHKRERMAEELTVLLNASPAELIEKRRTPRRTADSAAVAAFDDGATAPVEIIDFSLVGMTVKCARRPDIGAWVRIGATYGRVARYVDGGFALDFQPLPRRR